MSKEERNKKRAIESKDMTDEKRRASISLSLGGYAFVFSRTVLAVDTKIKSILLRCNAVVTRRGKQTTDRKQRTEMRG
jgi:hypothetical protein